MAERKAAAPATTAPPASVLGAVAGISAAQILLELVLTRIFSVTLYYHFAFLVVSLALFGIGVAGVAVSFSGWNRDSGSVRRAMTICCLAFTVATAGALVLVVNTGLPREQGWSALARLAGLYLGTALPFVFSGASLALAMTCWAEQAGRVYSYDLLGAALGCLLTVPLLDRLGGLNAALLAGALGAGAALPLAWRSPRWRLAALLVSGGGLALVAGNLVWSWYRVPSVKALDERRVVFAQWNSHSRVTVSPGESDFMWMNIDSDAATRIFSARAWRGGQRSNLRFSETRLAALVYELPRRGRALIIGPGGGADILAALQKGVRRILGVEINNIIVSAVMRGRFADYSGRLYEQPGVEVVVGEGRSLVRRSREQFSYIQATLVDTWAATSAGAFTLSENTLYTVEAFSEFITHLEPDGILSMTRWLRQPPREFVRLLAIGTAALQGLGHPAPVAGHFFVAADDRMATMLLKASPFTGEELQRLREACRRDGLRVLFSPDRNSSRGLIERLLRSPHPEQVWQDYPLDISPPTDNRPFFFYTVKPGRFLSLLLGGNPEDEPAVRLLAQLLLVVMVLVLLFLLAPLAVGRLLELRASGRAALPAVAYFTCLGLGFIALEMAWMQHFVLFLGHPVYALLVVLLVLLAATGVGARLSERVSPQRLAPVIGRNTALLLLLILAYAWGLGPLFRVLVGWPLGLRLLLAALLLLPAGLLMGGFMPLGIRLLNHRRLVRLVPWAWGSNGAASVLGTVGAVVVSLNEGYRVTQALAALAYLAAALLAWYLGRRDTAES